MRPFFRNLVQLHHRTPAPATKTGERERERESMGGERWEDPAVDDREGDGENQRQPEHSRRKGRRDGKEEEEKKKKKKKKKKVRKEEQEQGADGRAEEGAAAAATVSIAVPGSIIDNAQSLELATLLAGQIARAATIFRIHEVIIFDSKASLVNDSIAKTANSDDNESGAPFLAKILHYLETPQYLRRSLFPMHNSLKFVGLLPPLDAPHHVRKHEWSPFREGVTLEERPQHSSGTLVNVGLSKNVMVEQILEPGVRVTVAMGSSRALGTDGLKQVVSPFTPQQEIGLYWGYKVRYASNFSSVFKSCPFEGGYDYTIGTSEHGLTVSSAELGIPTFRHLLIAFGGLGGLEECTEEDKSFKGKDVSQVFDTYLNTCPQQGSRTIRTEEAIFISLQYFQEPIKRSVQRFKQ